MAPGDHRISYCSGASGDTSTTSASYAADLRLPGHGRVWIPSVSDDYWNAAMPGGALVCCPVFKPARATVAVLLRDRGWGRCLVPARSRGLCVRCGDSSDLLSVGD